jgi:hypothetical protein
VTALAARAGSRSGPLAVNTATGEILDDEPVPTTPAVAPEGERE